MIFLRFRTIKLLSEYGQLEDRYNRDYSEPVRDTALKEYSYQVAQGHDPVVALKTVNDALSTLVKRHPVQLDTLEN